MSACSANTRHLKSLTVYFLLWTAVSCFLLDAGLLSSHHKICQPVVWHVLARVSAGMQQNTTFRMKPVLSTCSERQLKPSLFPVTSQRIPNAASTTHSNLSSLQHVIIIHITKPLHASANPYTYKCKLVVQVVQLLCESLHSFCVLVVLLSVTQPLYSFQFITHSADTYV